MNDGTKPTKSQRGRPRTGTLEMRGAQWFARLTVNVDGEPLRRWFPLGTADRSAARRKLVRLVAELAKGAPTPAAEDTKSPETVDGYARGWLESRERRGIASAEYERRLYERVWKPAIGRRPLGEVTAADIRGVVADCADGKILPVKRKHQKAEPKRYSRQSIAHIRAVAFRLFDAAWRDELIPENRVARVSLPELEEERKVRAVLTDEEIGQLVAHPEVDAEIKLLLLLSRTVGGIRSGDLNRLDWTAFSPGFETCTLVRRKTRRKKPMPTTFEVPSGIRPFIAAWCARNGSPDAGPVFPVRKGPRAGKAKKASNMSYADRLRRALVAAGVTRHELHHETATTRPCDFHSTRRGFSQALARIGMNAQGAAELTGHADLKTHALYLASSTVKVLPSAAVPTLDPGLALLVATRNRPKRVAKLLNDGGAANDQSPLQPLGIAVGSDLQAGLAQLVEHELPKLGVTGSSPVSRSRIPRFSGDFFWSARRTDASNVRSTGMRGVAASGSTRIDWAST
jgi:integrase